MDKAKAHEVFQTVGISEDRFWELVAKADWPNRDYNRVKLDYLNTLTSDEGIKFRKALGKLWNVLDGVIGDERNPAQGGDDSHSDFIYHIIGLGKVEFYASMDDYSRMEQRGSDMDYKESFGYCVPYEDEWKNPQDEIESLKNIIQRREEKKAGVEVPEVKGFLEIIDEISDALQEADGDFIAEIYNRVCSEQVEYVEDSTWKTIESV